MAAKRDTDKGIAYLDEHRRAQELKIILDGKGRPRPCDHNIKQFVGADPHYSGVFYDDFLARVRNAERDWTDHDERAALCALQAAHQVAGFTLGQVRNAFQALAYERRRDSLRTFVKALPNWDRTARIEHALCDGWGAADTPLNRAASRNLFLSMIARALNPGAQVDTLWAFEGPQGTLKSRSLRELGRELHAEISAPIGSPDYVRELRGKWLAELSEFDALRGREATTVKRVLSAVEDRIVEKYEKHASTYPRRCVFVATTNEATYWQDSTGARRLVPVKVGEINLELIAAQREQWFAEARERYDAGESWWQYPAGIELAQEERQQVDPWEDVLRHAIAEGRPYHVGAMGIVDTIAWPAGFVSSAALMRDWLKLAPHQQGAGCGVRLGKVMRRLGFRPHREGKGRERGWVLADTQEGTDG